MRINVVAFGGLGGRLYSTGLQTIGLRVKKLPEVDFFSFEDYTSWRNWGRSFQNWKDPTVLLTHSYGVAAGFGAVRACGDKGPKFPLVISFDPSQYAPISLGLIGSGGNWVPDRVTRVINFYQMPTIPLLGIGGQRLLRDDRSTVGIENIQVSAVHHAIEDMPALQNAAVDAITKLAKGK